MKNRIFLFLILCFFGCVCCQAEKENLSKEALKSYKKVCKQLKADGWTVYDKIQSVDDAMMQYYLQLECGADSMQQVIGMGRDKNVNKAYSQARHRACVSQASQKGSNIKVITDMLMSSSSGCSTYVGTTLHAEQRIKPIAPVVSLCRMLKDGTTEINLYYLITEH